MAEEERYGVVEGVEDGEEHQLILALGSDDVEGQVDRRLVQYELVVVQKDVACKSRVESACSVTERAEHAAAGDVPFALLVLSQMVFSNWRCSLRDWKGCLNWVGFLGSW